MRRYWRFVVPAVLFGVVIVGLLISLRSNLVFFNTPTEVVAETPGDTRMRLGGEVVPGSVLSDDEGVDFDVTDGITVVGVHHQGAPQQLFQEGIGVIVEGTWDGAAFISDAMLVQHDEQYRTESGEVYVPGEPLEPSSDAGSGDAVPEGSAP